MEHSNTTSGSTRCIAAMSIASGTIPERRIHAVSLGDKEEGERIPSEEIKSGTDNVLMMEDDSAGIDGEQEQIEDTKADWQGDGVAIRSAKLKSATQAEGADSILDRKMRIATRSVQVAEVRTAVDGKEVEGSGDGVGIRSAELEPTREGADSILDEKMRIVTRSARVAEARAALEEKELEGSGYGVGIRSAEIEPTTPGEGGDSSLDTKIGIATKPVQVAEARAALGESDECCATGYNKKNVTADLMGPLEGVGLKVVDSAKPGPTSVSPGASAHDDDTQMVNNSLTSGPPTLLSSRPSSLDRGVSMISDPEERVEDGMEESVGPSFTLPLARDTTLALGTAPPTTPGAYAMAGLRDIRVEETQSVVEEHEQIAMDDVWFEGAAGNEDTPVIAYTVPEDPPLVPATRIEYDGGGANETFAEDMSLERPTTMNGNWGIDFRKRTVQIIFIVVVMLFIGTVVIVSITVSGGGGESSSTSTGSSKTSTPPVLPIPIAPSTPMPSQDPTALSAPLPTLRPTDSPVPTPVPTSSPTHMPTANPTAWPTSTPTYHPTVSPVPSTPLPTAHPTSSPTLVPTNMPWLQVGNDIDGDAEYDRFGRSVSLSESGSRLAIGAPYHDRNGLKDRGLVRFFVLKGGEGVDWAQLGDDLLGDSAGDLFGWSVSMSENGQRLAVGAYGHDGNRGQVKIFELKSGNWTLLGSPLVGEKWDWSGYSVSLSFDGTVVAIGAPGNGNDSGHVRIFQYASGAETWTLLRDDIDGEAAGDRFGRAVSLSSNGLTVAIGAPFNDGENAQGMNGPNIGHVRVYTYESSWKQIGQDIDGEATDDWSGRSVSLSANGNIVAVGAPRNDGNGDRSGHVKVYKYDEGEERWSQLGNDVDGESAYDQSGEAFTVSLSSDGSVVAVGAYLNDENGDRSGHVRVRKFDGNGWVQVGADIDGEAGGDRSGTSVSLSGDGNRVAIGAPHNDANGDEAGHARVYNLALV